MATRLALVADRLRGSLFFVPSLFVSAAVLLAVAMILVDRHITPPADDLSFFVASTVGSAREILSTVAAATITVAGIAFSVTLLVVQMASSQYSPRVVHGLFRDPLNKRVMGVVVGTFTYCLVVLQSVRSEVTDTGEAVVPNLAVLVALVLGVVSILAVVVFINHNAHSMDVSEILQAVTDQTLDVITSTWPEPGDSLPPLPEPRPTSDGFVVTFASNGWVQRVDEGALLRLVEPGGVVMFHLGVGRYAIDGVALATLWPRPSDPESVTNRARRATVLGRTRTLSQDPGYGLRQLADVGIRALSSGIDDPTTAQDAIFHLAAVLRELHHRVPPAAVIADDEDRTVVFTQAPDHAEMVALAFDELRRSAARHPAVCVYLLEALHLLCRSEDPPPPTDAVEAMHRQAELVVQGVAHAGLPPHDHEVVLAAHRARFTAR